jgi:uncharacterized protein (DUF2132 family)
VHWLLNAQNTGTNDMSTQPNNPLHGITLEALLRELQEGLGWQALGEEVNIRCFTQDPSIASSLKFLRRTPWAREKVETLYLQFKQQEL